MLRINFITFWRHLKKNKTISFINILGLAIGLSTAILAVIFAYHELTFEKNHSRSDRIYRVYTYGKVGQLTKFPTTWGPVAEKLSLSFPEFEKVARTRELSAIGFINNLPVHESNIMVADSTIFSIFSFDLLHGSYAEGSSQVLISHKTATKYFDKKNPAGEILTLKINGKKYDFMVAGVFTDFPTNTHIHKSSIIIPFSFAKNLNWDYDRFHSTSYGVYAMTYPDVDYKSLNEKIAAQLEIPVDVEDVKAFLVPIERIHLHENIRENANTNLWILLIGGLVALFIACFNYININTILFSTRSLEVGIKKSFGAGKFAIFTQFISNTFFTTLFSFFLAVLILYHILPGFNTMFDTNLGVTPNLVTSLLILGVFLLTIFLSGFYPAMVLSGFKPVNLLRTSKNGSLAGKKRLMNSLITLQFIVAIILLQFLILNERQYQYLSDENVIGYNGENVLCINGWQWGDLNVVKNELEQIPGIESVSWANTVPSVGMGMTSEWKEEGNKEMAFQLWAEADYLDVFDIKMIEGRFFTRQMMENNPNLVVINQQTANSLNYKDPVGRQMMINGKLFEIIGVVDNYQALPPIFHDMPMLINKSGNKNEYLVMEIQPENQKQIIAEVKQTLKKFNPEYPVDITFYEDHTAEMAKSYYNTGIMTNIFTGIIIFNAMMGLFGLSFFMAERKSKEIGVRKICGASILNITWNLFRRFLWLLLIAFAIATPMVYFAGTGYLMVFPRHIELGPDLFILGGILALGMLLLAAGWKIFYAARKNPVEVLRYE